MEVNFTYQGKETLFDLGDELYVDATSMAKDYNKRVVDWLRLPSTKELIEAFVKCENLTSPNKPYYTKRGAY